MEKTSVVTIVGQPNVGKSTFLNMIMGQKIVMTSRKPQATRFSTRACLNINDTQLVFVDTPGFLAPHNKLQEFIVKNARRSLNNEIDLVLFMIEKAHITNDRKTNISSYRDIVLSMKKDLDYRVLFVITKCDQDVKLENAEIMSYIKEVCSGTHLDIESDRLVSNSEEMYFKISSTTGLGVQELIKALCEISPEKPWLFSEDNYTDMTERKLAEEITREEIYNHLHKEIPYSADVGTESWKEEEDILSIHQVIYLSKQSQKAVVIGKGGQKLKKIGSAARKKVAAALDRKVRLFLYVKVKEDWIEKLK